MRSNRRMMQKKAGNPMHWLEKWRIKNQCSRKQLGKMAKCSESLIELIEEAGYITHHGIADRIADVTGATPRQRDKLVHKKHRGTYTQRKTPLFLEYSKKAVAAKPRLSYGGKTTVKINLACIAEERYPSMNAAAEAHDKEQFFVYSRCMGRMLENEFLPYGFTFRLEKDWTPAEARRLRAAAEEARERMSKGVFKFGNSYYIALPGGSEKMTDWCEKNRISPADIHVLIRKGKTAAEAIDEVIKLRGLNAR